MPEISQNFFISAGVNLTNESKELQTAVNIPKRALVKRWSSQEGAYILTRWKSNAFSRRTLEEMVGKLHGHTDLRGIPLQKENFHDVDLSNVDLFAANLRGCQFERVSFCNN